MAKVRFQIFLDEYQKETLRKLQKESKIPLAEMIRKAIDRFLAEWNGKKGKPVTDEMTKRLLSVAGICKGGPKDLADKHDRYLYGIPRE